MGKNIIPVVSAIFLSTVTTTIIAGELHVGAGEAYITIQGGIDAAVAGDVVIVADGTYTGDGNRDIDFLGKAITVRSENGPELCVIDCEGSEAEPHRGFYFHNSEDANSVVEGVTITNGYGATEEVIGLTLSFGGAVFCNSSNPTLRGCVIRYNYAAIGAFIALYNSSVAMEDIVVENNTAELWGGGIYSASSEVIVKRCRFVGNVGGGSAIHCRDGKLVVRESLMFANHSPENTSACVIFGYENEIKVGNSVICGYLKDHELYSGTAISALRGCSLQMDNCTITNNVNKSSSIAGGVFLAKVSSARIRNCIFWGNSGGSEPQISGNESVMDIAYCVIERGEEGISLEDDLSSIEWGEGMVDEDPQLAGDWVHLTSGSGCLDAGDPDYAAESEEKDADGEERIISTRIDIGADEFFDSDSDKLADWWEIENFVLVTTAGTGGNPDGDEWSNVEEYGRQSDPSVNSTLYVDATNGNDGWNGRAEAWDGENGPKRTIQAGVDSCDNGVVILSPGKYRGDGNRDITFRGKAVIVRSIEPTDWDVVKNTVVDCGETSIDNRHIGFGLADHETRYAGISGLTIVNAGGGNAYGIFSTGSAKISNCIIQDNFGHNNGGGIYCGGGAGTISNCIIRQNTATGIRGGGICVGPGGRALIENCLISSNYVYSHFGGGIFVDRAGEPEIVNCTITNNCNSQGREGSGIYFYADADPTVTNCILWGNSSEQIYFDGQGWEDRVNYCCIDGYISSDSGMGNFGDNPLFVKDGYGNDNGTGIPEGPFLVDGNYRLQSNSPCINKADESNDYSGQNDIDGAERIVYGRADTGTYEYVLRDFSGDEKVNLVDFSVFASRWLEENCIVDSFCGGADYLGNGTVGLDDLLFFSDGWMMGWKSPAIGYWSFDESGSSVASDNSDSGWDGTLLNMEEDDWVGGKFGNCLSFDGGDDYVQISGYTGIGGGASRSVCAWIQTFDTEGEIVSWGDIGVDGGRWVIRTDVSGFLRAEVGSGYILGSTPVCDGEWHHVAVVLENDGSPNVNEIRLYVDGEEDVPSLNASDRAVNTSLGPDVTIGVWGPANRYFEGLIDEVRIYDRALSEVEIRALGE